MCIFQVISDLSDNLECLNGKLNALNKFIHQLKELNSWVIIKRSEAEEFHTKPIAERKLATEKLQVSFSFIFALNKVLLKLLKNYFNY